MLGQRGRLGHAPADSTLYRTMMRGLSLLTQSGTGIDGVGSVRHRSQGAWRGARAAAVCVDEEVSKVFFLDRVLQRLAEQIIEGVHKEAFLKVFFQDRVSWAQVLREQTKHPPFHLWKVWRRSGGAALRRVLLRTFRTFSSCTRRSPWPPGHLLRAPCAKQSLDPVVSDFGLSPIRLDREVAGTLGVIPGVQSPSKLVAH